MRRGLMNVDDRLEMRRSGFRLIGRHLREERRKGDENMRGLVNEVERRK
jgi:hypothetical protein